MSSASFYSHHMHLIRSQMCNKVLMPPEQITLKIRLKSTATKLTRCEFRLVCHRHKKTFTFIRLADAFIQSISNHFMCWEVMCYYCVIKHHSHLVQDVFISTLTIMIFSVQIQSLQTLLCPLNMSVKFHCRC